MEATNSKHSNKIQINSTNTNNSSTLSQNQNKTEIPKVEKKIVTFSIAWNELKSSPKELYLIFILKFLESYSYFAIIYTLIIFLSDEYKYTDEEAGWSYGIFGMCTSIYGFIFGGFLIDNLGVKLSLCLGCSILLIGRLLLVISTSHLHILIILYTILPIGTCLGIPVMQIGIRRYTTENSRSLAFSIFYGMMNVSAIFSASSIDFCRRFLVDTKINLLGFINFELNSYRTLFLFGVITTLLSLLISLCLNDHDYEKQNENGGGDSDGIVYNNENMFIDESDGNKSNSMQIEEEQLLMTTKNNSNILSGTSKNINNYTSSTATHNTSANISHTNLYDSEKNSDGLQLNNKIIINNSTTIPKKKLIGACTIIKEVTSQKSFWKFVCTIILLMGVRIVYRHLDATFPKYMIREFGKEIMYGSIIAINPFLIVILIPIFAPLSYQFSAYNQITFGAFLTAISPFFLVIGTHLWSAVMFVVILSIGEALWSPRLYEYTIFITEKGREGIYMALASSPMFVATLITGATSGFFLENYCPEKGPRESWKMWWYIGIITLTSPILLLYFKNKIEITESELNNERMERKKIILQIEEEKLKNKTGSDQEVIENNSKILNNYNNLNSVQSRFSPKNLSISNNIEFDIKAFQIHKQEEFSMSENKREEFNK